MKNSKFDVEYENDNVRNYRNVTIYRNPKIKIGDLGCYYVKDSQRTSIADAKEYIDSMIEACGVEFFNTRSNPLIDPEFS